MTLGRDSVPLIASARLGCRPVRWAPEGQCIGDYDGRTRSLEIFLAEPHDQLPLLRSLRGLREQLQQAAGGPIVWLFHTRAESERLYGDFLREWASEPTALSLDPSDVVALPAQDQHVPRGAACAHKRAA